MASQVKSCVGDHVITQQVVGTMTCLQNGATFRYAQPSIEAPYLLLSEVALSQTVQTKYALGTNSGGSALYLAIAAVKHIYGIRGNKVLTNSFTFNAVPSSIVHAGCTPVLVETDRTLNIDLDDLERKMVDHQADCLVLSYMRGRVPDIDRVLALCKKHGVRLIEDIAHALGVKWKGQPVGSFGLASGTSTQAHKIISSGEGGFMFTNDHDIQAYCIVAAGSYETLYRHHGVMMPPEKTMQKYVTTVANRSLRMSNVAGALVHPQINQLEARVIRFNTAYQTTVKGLRHLVETIPQHFNVRPCYDSCQFRLPFTGDSKTRFTKTQRFCELARARGLKMGNFVAPENARNYSSWGFIAGGVPDLKKTDTHLADIVDFRLGKTKPHEIIDVVTECFWLAERATKL